jgi:hypothetical protein
MWKYLEIFLLDASPKVLESFFLGLPSRVLESTILPTWMNLFFQWLNSASQSMGGHTHACQAFLFQEVDLVDQGSYLRSFEQSRFFTSSSLELEKSAYEGREVGFMLLTVEPCFMPSPERILQGEIKETSTREGL